MAPVYSRDRNGKVVAVSGITRLIDTPDGPVRHYYPTPAQQFERQRRDRERNLRRSAPQGRQGAATA